MSLMKNVKAKCCLAIPEKNQILVKNLAKKKVVKTSRIILSSAELLVRASLQSIAAGIVFGFLEITGTHSNLQQSILVPKPKVAFSIRKLRKVTKVALKAKLVDVSIGSLQSSDWISQTW